MFRRSAARALGAILFTCGLPSITAGCGEGVPAFQGGDAPGAARSVLGMRGFEATIDGAGVRLSPAGAGSWGLSLSTAGIGCEGSLEAALPAGAVETSGDRVEIARGSVREWYVRGPLGLEQGFTLER